MAIAEQETHERFGDDASSHGTESDRKILMFRMFFIKQLRSLAQNIEPERRVAFKFGPKFMHVDNARLHRGVVDGRFADHEFVVAQWPHTHRTSHILSGRQAKAQPTDQVASGKGIRSRSDSRW
jgi:hypothetical protein